MWIDAVVGAVSPRRGAPAQRSAEARQCQKAQSTSVTATRSASAAEARQVQKAQSTSVAATRSASAAERGGASVPESADDKCNRDAERQRSGASVPESARRVSVRKLSRQVWPRRGDAVYSLYSFLQTVWARPMVIAYHVIFGAYGFWLPNDPRGSWSDFVGSWNLFRYGPATKTEETRSLAYEPHDHEKRRATKKALKYRPVEFTGIQARAIGRGFGNYVKSSGLVVRACAILRRG
jgi:hypothetical protein